MFRPAYLALFCAGLVLSQDPPRDLTNASLEELMNIEVTSASKKSQSLAKTAASVYVITAEDIRRSGMSTLPEVLRLAPGVQVARTDSGGWAVSIRGFQNEYSNQLLVLVDGRSVYNELFGGVFWQLVQMPLENIERIEVIRGPVAALWGTNAVNGAINIITKKASDSQGVLLRTEAGTEKESTSAAQFGGEIGSSASYRIGGDFSHHDAFTSTMLPPASLPTSGYGWNGGSLDFRLDWNARPSDRITVQAQDYQSTMGREVLTPSAENPFPAPVDVRENWSAAFVTGEWEHTISEDSSLEVRASLTRVHAGDVTLPDNYTIADFDFQHRRALGARNDVVWGVMLTESHYDSVSTASAGIQPAHADRDRAAVFAEDQIELIPDKLSFIAGAQWGWTPEDGPEFQPTARLLWTPKPNLATWMAASQAVRTPDIVERGYSATIFAYPAPPLFVLVQEKPNPNAVVEPMVAYEIGERVQAGKRASLDVSAFYNNYRRVECVMLETPFLTVDGSGVPYLELTAQLSDQCRGTSYGGEASATWSVATHWRVTGGYSWMRLNARSLESADLLNFGDKQGQWLLRSEADLTRRLQFDAALYHYGATPEYGQIPGSGIGPYSRLDARLGWTVSKNLDISVGVQNALRPAQAEFFSTRIGELLEPHRNIYGKMTWRF